VTSDEFDELKTLIRSEVGAVRADLQSELGAVRADLQSEVGGVRSDVAGLRSEMGEVRADVTGLRSEMGEVRADVTGLRSEMGGLSSEYQNLIGFLSKKFDRIDTRFTRLEVGQEAFGAKLAIVGEGVTSNGRQLGRVGERIDGVEGLVRELAGLNPTSE
jgi:chromosome segregation ATPase